MTVVIKMTRFLVLREPDSQILVTAWALLISWIKYRFFKDRKPEPSDIFPFKEKKTNKRPYQNWKEVESDLKSHSANEYNRYHRYSLPCNVPEGGGMKSKRELRSIMIKDKQFLVKVKAIHEILYLTVYIPHK